MTMYYAVTAVWYIAGEQHEEGVARHVLTKDLVSMIERGFACHGADEVVVTIDCMPD